MKKLLIVAVALTAMFAASCSKSGIQPTAVNSTPASAMRGAGTPSGIQTAIPAYYDSMIFKILFAQFKDKAAQTLIAHNPGINFIYQSDPGLPGGQPFISVIDAIPGDGMNPVWEEVQITFTAGHTPRQLYSDDQVAAAAASGEITLTNTGEVYWCPVIGKKP